MNNEDPADPSVHEPRVTDAPAEIWLVYGELEHDDTHANLYRDGDVTWGQHQIGASDVRYVRADAIAAERERTRAKEPCGDNPAADVALPPPVAWVQPDHLQKARMAPFLCRVEPTQRHADFVPIYTADQMRAATAAMRAQDSEHRSAQAAVYAALGPGADPDRATWPDQIRTLRERADAADTVAQGAAQVRG